jgi:hypothetical protein
LLRTYEKVEPETDALNVFVVSLNLYAIIFKPLFWAGAVHVIVAEFPDNVATTF